MPNPTYTVASRLIAVIAISVAALLLALPGVARAATPPTILTAGFDAEDQLYATWTLAPGTTYEMIEFATVPTPDWSLGEFFADDNFAGFDACDDRSCAGVTSYTSSYPVLRDRRYFVKVTAIDGEDHLNSAVWVIDETQPVRPGDADVGSGETNRPVSGRPFVPVPVPAGTSIALLTPPKTIAGVLRKGLRVTVACPTACGATGLVTRFQRDRVVGRVDKSYGGGGSRPFTMRITAAGRKQLRPLKRTKLRIFVSVFLFDGSIANLSKTITVRR